jgi:hypothetical protein
MYAPVMYMYINFFKMSGSAERQTRMLLDQHNATMMDLKLFQTHNHRCIMPLVNAGVQLQVGAIFE